jgi:hypothetical protein
MNSDDSKFYEGNPCKKCQQTLKYKSCRGCVNCHRVPKDLLKNRVKKTT